MLVVIRLLVVDADTLAGAFVGQVLKMPSDHDDQGDGVGSLLVSVV